jgi:hypothetical protein
VVVEEAVVEAATATATATATTTRRPLLHRPLRLRHPVGHPVGLPAPVMVTATTILRLRPRVGLLAATPATATLEMMEMTPETKILEPLTPKQKLLLPKPLLL